MKAHFGLREVVIIKIFGKLVTLGMHVGSLMMFYFTGLCFRVNLSIICITYIIISS